MDTSFILRPFPPPALADVPLEYVIDQLHRYAPRYWDNPDTTDCTLIIPVFDNDFDPRRPSDACPEQAPSSMVGASAHDPSGSGRRATEPTLHFVPRLVMNLHMDYLSFQSTFLRALFGGAGPLDLISPRASTCPLGLDHSGRPTSLSPVPGHLPRLLPSSPSHPTIYLPVPDPSSIRLIIHWMYFGKTDYIEEALDQGTATVDGLARNIEYLGLPQDIKVFLGRWYNKCRRVRCAETGAEDDTDNTDNTDDNCSVELSSAGEVAEDFEEPLRGRSTSARGIQGSISITSPRVTHRFSIG